MLNLVEFIGTDRSCVVCGRPKSAQQGIEHNGWCWWCVKNRMEGRGYDSYGKPFTISKV